PKGEKPRHHPKDFVGAFSFSELRIWNKWLRNHCRVASKAQVMLSRLNVLPTSACSQITYIVLVQADADTRFCFLLSPR
ncbi:MAG: hypothetical protein OXF19_08270, partial [Hyphomicrobiales bacterium]|nr:hypothetical protein [Hyphomicrobiales bacterium]